MVDSKQYSFIFKGHFFHCSHHVSFIYPTNFFSTYRELSTVLSAEDATVNKTDKVPTFLSIHSSRGNR